MATTTNYGWTTPDDTALVKDGAAAIRSLGSSIDTTTKNLNPSTTLGDIEYRSATANTNTRLAIGSTGNVLTVSGGVPVWSAPTGGSFTQLASGSLPTNANNFTISSISGAYTDLRIELSGARVTTDDNIYLRLNGNSGSVYFATDFEGSGVADSTAGTTCRLQGSTDSATGNGFTYAIILDYTGSHWKIIRSAFMVPNASTPANARGQSYLNGSTITDAITSINFYTESTNNFSAGTYKLYGVK